MNKGIYQADGRLWADWPESKKSDYYDPHPAAENEGGFDLVGYYSDHEKWESRPFIPVHPDLQKVFEVGKLYEKWKDYKLGLSDYTTFNLETGREEGRPTIAIPIPAKSNNKAMTHYIVVSKTEIVKAEMESPECWMYPGPTPMECNDCLKFIDHLASLPRIPIHGKHNWKVWQEVVEGRDVEFDLIDNRGWQGQWVAIPIEQTKSEQGGNVFGEWQLCPKCNGQGLIEKPPYLAAEVTEWVSTGEVFTCDVCNGAKVLARPLLNNNPQTK